ncbi:hypothetical protein SUGI_0567410 [Cryptomeria japonica]|uniref:Similarity to ribonuclease III n=1 Tax=Cryptomeria japonica TaxID=3369 RepID=Q1XG54_CRYJA|nr:uncharacterized protein LOC131036385 isoform X1 [Cryptomeria japonica]BAE92294.1 similarity to ribonuclease III [Cryptomeria japonica]GLJ28778.1 hypothetical protein SUGI_0567410 [Cryptomeria japonica]
MAFAAQLLTFSALLIISQAYSGVDQKTHSAMEASDDAAIKALQTKIRYQFKDQTLLILAITHASYSFDNNGALNVLGYNIIQAAISLHYVLNNSAIGSGDLHSKISELSNCTVLSKDAFDLQLHDLIKVAPKINPKKQSILCGCYRALFGAIGADANLDVAKEKFLIRRKLNAASIMQKHLTQGGLRSELL